MKKLGQSFAFTYYPYHLMSFFSVGYLSFGLSVTSFSNGDLMIWCFCSLVYWAMKGWKLLILKGARKMLKMKQEEEDGNRR